jgi:molecular chaperone IbpA
MQVKPYIAPVTSTTAPVKKNPQISLFDQIFGDRPEYHRFGQFDLLFDSVIDDFNRVFGDFSFTQSGFPPHNVLKLSDNEYKLELAVAGFKAEELNISVTNGILRICGNRKQEEEGADQKYIHRGLAARSFVREFAIAKTSEVTAKYDAGILEIYISTPPPPQQTEVKVSIKT